MATLCFIGMTRGAKKKEADHEELVQGIVHGNVENMKGKAFPTWVPIYAGAIQLGQEAHFHC
jgi:hypothetical protein